VNHDIRRVTISTTRPIGLRYIAFMIHRKPTPFVLPVVALLAFACDAGEPEYSDSEQWRVEVGLSDVLHGIDRPSHVLVGSRVGVSVSDYRDDDGGYTRLEPELENCVHLFGNGSVEWVEQPDGTGDFRQVSAGPGSVGISAPREACPEYTGPAEAFERDEWSTIGVEPSETFGEWANHYDHQTLVVGSSGPVDGFPAELGQALGGVRVAEGGAFSINPVLMHLVDDEAFEVRHAHPELGLVVPADQQALILDPDGFPRFRLSGELDAGESVGASVAIGGADNVALPGVEAVPVDTIESLELVAVYEPDYTGERGWGRPLGVMALAHDAEGQRILGAPIEWSITEGLLMLEPASDASDVLWATDMCRKDPLGKDRRDATIEARVGEVVASVELEWTALRVDEVDVDPDSPLCQGSSSCDCSATATPTNSLAAMLGLLLLGVGLRRGRPARRHVGQ
jgi:hypothetical protein